MDRDLAMGAPDGSVRGIAILYFSAVGMVTTFDARTWWYPITLGKILGGRPLLVGYLAARPGGARRARSPLEPRQVALTGVLAGLAAGVVVAIAGSSSS
jgi:hypothetical protein